jgi:nickel-dependent lactate racemase
MFLVVSDVKSHYFAGYSNPVKYFLPGICAFKTAEQNHSFTLNDKSQFGSHPWHPDESRTDNPLAADMLEGMEMIAAGRSVYALVTISGPDGISWSQFGLARQVSAESFLEADKHNMHKVAPAERLIVSPGGEPNDIDLYTAQRALELTKQAVKDDGEILFIAACPGGAGQKHTMENFYNRLTKPIDDILNADRSEYKLFSHKPYRFAELIERMRRIYVHSEMPAKLVEAAHLCPVDDPQAVVDGWISQDCSVRITIVDGANKIALLGN